jgi:hypothetical protein
VRRLVGVERALLLGSLVGLVLGDLVGDFANVLPLEQPVRRINTNIKQLLGGLLVEAVLSTI